MYYRPDEVRETWSLYFRERFELHIRLYIGRRLLL